MTAPIPRRSRCAPAALITSIGEASRREHVFEKAPSASARWMTTIWSSPTKPSPRYHCRIVQEEGGYRSATSAPPTAPSSAASRPEASSASGTIIGLGKAKSSSSPGQRKRDRPFTQKNHHRGHYRRKHQTLNLVQLRWAWRWSCGHAADGFCDWAGCVSDRATAMGPSIQTKLHSTVREQGA